MRAILVCILFVLSLTARAGEIDPGLFRMYYRMYQLSTDEEFVRKIGILAHSADQQDREDAAFLIGRIYKQFPRREISMILVSLLKDSVARVRYSALQSTDLVFNELEEIKPVVEALLKDPDPDVRRVAEIQALQIAEQLRQKKR
jgi:uncharacterized protein (DUF2336 family)